MSKEFDVVIAGRGAAAFSSAIKISELTSNQASIGVIGTGPMGGTCVNVGCVPSKYLLEASHNVFGPFHPKMAGIIPSRVDYSFPSVMKGLQDYVEKARSSKYEAVIEKYENVSIIDGKARFKDPRTVQVITKSGGKIDEISGSNFIVATGSTPSVPKIEGLKEVDYITSDTIWNLNELPNRFVVIGGGAIGLELGQAMLHLGSDVTIIEALDSLVPQSEPEIGSALMERLKSEGMKFHMRARVSSVNHSKGMDTVEIITHGGKEKVEADKILVATGRKANTPDLNLEAAHIEVDGRGQIKTDRKMRTSSTGIYAAGDCVSKSLFLETLAAREGVVAASNIFGQDMEIDYDSAAWAVFTYPQVAGVGMTEKEFSKKNGSCSCRTFSLSNLTKASIMGETDGLIKITVDPADNRIVGMHIFSPSATDIITEGSYAVAKRFKVDDIIATSHIFPSLSEGIKLASQSFIRDISKMSCCVE